MAISIPWNVKFHYSDVIKVLWSFESPDTQLFDSSFGLEEIDLKKIEMLDGFPCLDFTIRVFINTFH